VADLNPRVFFVLLSAYFLIHIISRVVVSDSLQLDEAEQLIMAQEWRPGYGSQPPLYTWLQQLFFSVFGISVLSLALLKNMLLWSIYVLTYLAAKEVFDRNEHAMLASVAMLFVPCIAWESQRDQTHLVLATACTAATWLVFLKLLKRPTAFHYVALGLVIAAGVLSKYNYALVPIALVVAALLSRELRPAVSDKRMLLTLAAFAVPTVPHFYWALQETALWLTQSGKLRMNAVAPVYLVYLWGLVHLAKALLTYAIVPVIVFALGFFPFWTAHRRSTLTGTLPRFVFRAMIVGLIVTLVAILAFRVTSIRTRWLQPVLYALPILLVIWAPPVLDRRLTRRLFGLAAVSAFAVLVAANGTVLAAGRLNRGHNLNAPYRELAAQMQQTGFQRGVILAPNKVIAGNLKLWFADSTVLCPEIHRMSYAQNVPRLIVWQANPRTSPRVVFSTTSSAPPRQLRIHRSSAPARHGDPGQLNLEFALVEDPNASLGPLRHPGGAILRKQPFVSAGAVRSR